MFKNRTEAGLLLAQKLKNFSNNKNVIVVTIPRGGLPLGYTIATQLHAPLEIVLSKKIGHPANNNSLTIWFIIKSDAGVIIFSEIKPAWFVR